MRERETKPPGLGGRGRQAVCVPLVFLSFLQVVVGRQVRATHGKRKLGSEEKSPDR